MQLTGIGLYTFPEAARLVGVRPRVLRRWLQGYTKGKNEDVRFYPPLWKPEIVDADMDGLSFHDLLEVRFIKAFRELGISLQTIRIAAANARSIFESSYPFTCERFQTDGETIFAEAMRESGEIELLDLRRRQYVFERIVRSSLYAGIEFNASKRAVRWFPMKHSEAVVLDPAIAFGKPVVTEVGLRTDILYDAWLAERKDKQRVARLYEIPTKAVNAAIRFERLQAA
jgi:DNA-binding transcriptional MerR regulator/uncharacterized protein (DUF433 family)